MAGSQAESVLRHFHHLLKSRGVPSEDRQLPESFVARRDEDAFAELVARHGPLVYGVWLTPINPQHSSGRRDL